MENKTTMHNQLGYILGIGASSLVGLITLLSNSLLKALEATALVAIVSYITTELCKWLHKYLKTKFKKNGRH